MRSGNAASVVPASRCGRPIPRRLRPRPPRSIYPMLKHRLITAAILIPLVVGLVLLAPSWAIALAFGIVVLLGVPEWVRLCGGSQAGLRLGALVVMAAALGGLWFVIDEPRFRLLLWLLAALWWFRVTVSIVLVNAPVVEAPKGVRALELLQGFVVLLPAWAALVTLHGAGDTGPLRVLLLLVLIWGADSAAYFAGRRFGRHKLAPHVSPGKTWEGAAGAALGGALCALLFWRVLPGQAGLGFWLGICLMVTAVSIVGDLYESLVKRRAGMKDSGTLLPGHGGVLDRIDSLTAAAPIFVLGLEWHGVLA